MTATHVSQNAYRVSEALEEQVRALTFVRRIQRYPDIRMNANPEEVKHWGLDEHVLERAEPYFWNSLATRITMDAAKDFDLTQIVATRSLVPDDYSWHYFSEHSPFAIETRAGSSLTRAQTVYAPVEAISSYWVKLISAKTGLIVPHLGATAWGRADCRPDGTFTGPLTPMLWCSFPENESIGSPATVPRFGAHTPRTTEELTELRKFIVSSATFLRQRLFTTTSQAAERHARKRLAQAASPLLSDRRIRIVNLRRSASSPSSGESAPRDWSFQWTVRGHVRQQFYPSLNEHLPVYIHPHIKGPEGKPLKPRTSPIFSVTR